MWSATTIRSEVLVQTQDGSNSTTWARAMDRPPPAARSLPRRGVLLGGLAGAAAALVGCLSDRKTTADDTATGSTSAGSFPVTVSGKEGAATVRSAPQRVVAAGYLRDTDLALALGVPLVGAARNSVFASGLAPWQKPPTEPDLFDTTNGLPFEQIAALHPDLILASDDYTLTKDYATLAKIAPTLSYQAGVGADTWQPAPRVPGGSRR
jgi:iron complex transport system substrate-binding protein